MVKTGTRGPTLAKSIAQQKIDNVGTVLAIATGDLHATIALKPTKKVADLDIFYTQDGVEARLHDLILNNTSSSGRFRLAKLLFVGHLITRAGALRLFSRGTGKVIPRS